VCQIDETLCQACGECAEVCQFDALSVDDGYAAVDGKRCMGCGVCVSKCPQDAISLIRDAGKGEPLEIQQILAEASQTIAA
jgi:heterodisulfide reductase subunit A-like polyferredoxin